MHFSQKGDRLVAAYNGDHAYMFDTTSSGCTSAVYPVPSKVKPHVSGERMSSENKSGERMSSENVSGERMSTVKTRHA